MGFTDDHILIDYFDPRIIGFRILIHYRIINRVTHPPIATVILLHHQDILILLGKISERKCCVAVKTRIRFKRSKGMSLSDLALLTDQFKTCRKK